jgi:endogenous inhibitor of DNA gyrase (YacG/DUF329 family)
MPGAGKGGGGEGGEVVPLRAARPCPICGKPSARAAYPFCSKRCADVDLNRWLSGSYAIPASEEGASSDDDDGREPGSGPR